MLYAKYLPGNVLLLSLLLTSCGNHVSKENTITKTDTMLPADSHSVVKVVEDSAANTRKSMPNLTVTEIDELTQSALNARDSINRHLKSTRKFTTTIDGSTQMGEATVYIAADDTVKVIAVFYGETGKTVYEFYMRDSALIYYSSKDIDYAKSIFESPHVKIVKTDYKQYILNEQQVIRWWRNKKLMDGSPGDDPEWQHPVDLLRFVQEQVQDSDEK